MQELTTNLKLTSFLLSLSLSLSLSLCLSVSLSLSHSLAHTLSLSLYVCLSASAHINVPRFSISFPIFSPVVSFPFLPYSNLHVKGRLNGKWSSLWSCYNENSPQPRWLPVKQLQLIKPFLPFHPLLDPWYLYNSAVPNRNLLSYHCLFIHIFFSDYIFCRNKRLSEQKYCCCVSVIYFLTDIPI